MLDNWTVAFETASWFGFTRNDVETATLNVLLSKLLVDAFGVFVAVYTFQQMKFDVFVDEKTISA